MLHAHCNWNWSSYHYVHTKNELITVSHSLPQHTAHAPLAAGEQVAEFRATKYALGVTVTLLVT